MSNLEQTLSIIKPDAVERNLENEIKEIFRNTGLNINKEKKMTNMRAAGSDNTVNLRPPKRLSLDQSIELIAEDELVEITPE